LPGDADDRAAVLPVLRGQAARRPGARRPPLLRPGPRAAVRLLAGAAGGGARRPPRPGGARRPAPRPARAPPPRAPRPPPRRRGPYYADYAVGCNSCHTTLPLGDLFAHRPQQAGEHAPAPLHWSVGRYLREAHPDIVPAASGLPGREAVDNPMNRWEATRHAV